MMKINTRVETKLGTDTVVGYDKTCERLPRYGVQLDNNVFGWKINCYYFFTDEVKRIKDCN